MKQLEQYKELIQDILNEPIPEDPDVKMKIKKTVREGRTFSYSLFIG